MKCGSVPSSGGSLVFSKKFHIKDRSCGLWANAPLFSLKPNFQDLLLGRQPNVGAFCVQPAPPAQPGSPQVPVAPGTHGHMECHPIVKFKSKKTCVLSPPCTVAGHSSHLLVAQARGCLVTCGPPDPLMGSQQGPSAGKVKPGSLGLNPATPSLDLRGFEGWLRGTTG